jgi:hypothetical protein
VEAVSVAVCAAVLLNATEDGDRLHVGGADAPVGEVVTAQLSVTVPVNELPGVRVTVEVPLVAPEAMVMAALLVRVKLVLLSPLGACQKSPQPAITQTKRPTSTGIASSKRCGALLPMFIAAPDCLHCCHFRALEERLTDRVQFKEYRHCVRGVSPPD